MAEVFLALGSNLGERKDTLLHAIHLLGEHLREEVVSSLYETEPVGGIEQPLFLNCVVKGTTDESPLELLRHCLLIEQALGRVRTVRFGPRTLDIDLLFYDETTLSTQELTLPHPRLHERAFVLVPLAEIAPNLLHPVYQKTISELLHRLPLL